MQLSEQDDKLAQLINNLSLKKCDHGRPTFADGDACKLLMMEFERLLVLPNDDDPKSLFCCVLKALSSALEYSGCNIPSNGNDLEQARACLLAFGVDFLLGVCTRHQKA